MKELRAKDIMTRSILKVREDWSIHRLAEFFTENSISGAPVTSTDGKLVGVVTLSDIILQNTFTENDTPSYETHEYYLHTLEDRYTREEIASLKIKGEPMFTTRDIMTPTIFKVNEDTTIQEVADTLIKNRIHRVFVTHEEKVVGVISTVDMLKIIRDL